MLEKSRLDESVLVLAENQFLYRLDDTLIWLFNTENGELYNLNEFSFFVLSLFDGKKSVKEIRQLYVEKFSGMDTKKTVLMEDFNTLLTQFIDAHVFSLTKK